MVFFALHIILFCIASIFIVGNYGDENEKRLFKYLFDPSRIDAHNIMERPVENQNTSVVVNIGFYLIQLINVDERNGNTKLSMWFKLRWKDYQFNWNPQTYNGLSTINIPSEKIWKPDIFLYNSANDKVIFTVPTKVIAENTTSILWVPPGIVKANCLNDISWFPFDRQLCTMNFGSWTYNSDLLDIVLQCSDPCNDTCVIEGKINLSNFKKNDDFDITDNYIDRRHFEFCNQSYTYISVNLGFQRKYKYYIYNIIIPGILLSILAILMFTLPPDSKERISLGMVILLIITIFLLYVATKVPQSLNSVPIISKYFMFLMILCSLSIVCTIIVLNFNQQSKNEQSISTGVKDFINEWLATLIFMKYISKSEETKETEIKKHENLEYSRQGIMDPVKDEWRFAARVVDRYCLIIFIFATLIMTMITLCPLQPSKKDLG